MNAWLGWLGAAGGLITLVFALTGCAATPPANGLSPTMPLGLITTLTEHQKSPLLNFGSLACTEEGKCRPLISPSLAALRDQQHDRDAFYTHTDGTPWTAWDWLRYGLLLLGAVGLIGFLLGVQDWWEQRRPTP